MLSFAVFATSKYSRRCESWCCLFSASILLVDSGQTAGAKITQLQETDSQLQQPIDYCLGDDDGVVFFKSDVYSAGRSC